MNDAAAPVEPIPFRVLLDEAMKLTRRHVGALFLPVAIPLALFAGILTVVQVSFMTDFVSTGARAPVWTGRGCFVVFGALLGWLTIRALASAVLTAAAVDGASNRPIDIKSNWGFLFQPATLGTLFLSLAAILIGLCFLLFPGVYIGLRLSFLLPVMAAEGLRGMDAMKRSWNLVRYNPHKRFLDNTATKIFLLYLVAGVIGWAVNFVVQLPFTALQSIRMARVLSSGQAPAPFAPDYWVQVPSAILNSLVSTAIAIYTSFGIVLLYFDVVRRKEGTDLAAAIDARFGGPGPAPIAPGTP